MHSQRWKQYATLLCYLLILMFSLCISRVPFSMDPDIGAANTRGCCDGGDSVATSDWWQCAVFCRAACCSAAVRVITITACNSADHGDFKQRQSSQSSNQTLVTPPHSVTCSCLTVVTRSEPGYPDHPLRVLITITVVTKLDCSHILLFCISAWFSFRKICWRCCRMKPVKI